MSMQDSAAVVELSKIHPAVGAVASGVMGDTAGTQAMLDAKQGGATDEQALAGQGTVLCLNGMVEKTQKNGFQSCGRGS